MIAELQERYRVDEDSFISLYHILTYKALSKVSMFLTILPISNTGGSAADILVFCTPNLTPFPTWSTITSTNLLTGIWKVPNHVSAAPIILGFPAKTNVSADIPLCNYPPPPPPYSILRPFSWAYHWNQIQIL